MIFIRLGKAKKLIIDYLRLIIGGQWGFVLPFAYLTKLQSRNVDWWELTSVMEKEAIYESQLQLKNGKGIPHQEVRQKVDKLLGRK